MCSLNGDQSGQWRSIRKITMTTHFDITMGNDISRDIHCDITLSNYFAMCTYHGITMYSEVTMNILYYIFCALRLIVLFYYG